MTNWPGSDRSGAGQGRTPPVPRQAPIPPSVPQQPRPGSGYGPPADRGYGPRLTAFGGGNVQPAGQSPADRGYGPPPAVPAGYSQPPEMRGYGTPPGQSKKNRTPLLIGGGIVVLVIAMVAAWALLGGLGGSGGPASAKSAGDAVKGYLEALARGDANGALAYSDDQPASKDLLSDDILKQQITKWPITNIRVLSDDSTKSSIGFGQVHVAANFGDKTSDVTMSVKKSGDSWRLDHASIKLATDYAGTSNQANKALTIFSKALPDSGAYVFPGFLDFGSSNANLKVEVKPVLLDQLAMGSSGSPVQATWTLTDTANQTIMAAVKNITAACTASNLENPPPPCNAQAFGMADGTVHWGPADLSKVKVQNLDQYQGLTADVSGQAWFQVTGTDMFDGGPHAPEPVAMYVHGTADLTTAPPTVSFR